MSELLRVVNLKKYFYTKTGFFGKKEVIKAVDNVSFIVKEGETLGIVGESGSGKTTLGKCLLRLVEPTSGEIYFRDVNILKLDRKELKKIRRNMQIIFQNPYSSLDPRMKIGKIIEEPLKIHGVSVSERSKRVYELLDLVGLPRSFTRRYPHMLSGGQRQRVAIARALALNPKIIIADEPTSALDVSIQAQILNLLKELQKIYGLTYIYISHDMGTIRYMSSRIAVMYYGKIVELGNKKEVFDSPFHPYTIELLQSVPVPNPRKRKIKNLKDISYEKFVAVNNDGGCIYYLRCPFANSRCKDMKVELRELEKGHFVACLRAKGNYTRQIKLSTE
ncbi:MAG: ABC transporter ATP-binding protein [Thermoproteales archaeon]|nr:ABC transporter ATP-binding protein [Thermoproteales archaeon]